MESDTGRVFADMVKIHPIMKQGRPALFRHCAEAVNASAPEMAAPLPPKLFPGADLVY
jgi:hypothetical protein